MQPQATWHKQLALYSYLGLWLIVLLAVLLSTHPEELVLAWAGKIPPTSAYIVLATWLASLIWGIAWGMLDGLKGTTSSSDAPQNRGPESKDMTNPVVGRNTVAPPEPRRHGTRQIIVALAMVVAATIATIYWRSGELANARFWDFGLQIIATGVGVLLAFTLERAVEGWQRERADQTRQIDLDGVLAALSREIDVNIDALVELTRTDVGRLGREYVSHSLSEEVWATYRAKLPDLGCKPGEVYNYAMFYHYAGSAKALYAYGTDTAAGLGVTQARYATDWAQSFLRKTIPQPMSLDELRKTYGRPDKSEESLTEQDTPERNSPKPDS